MNSERLDQVLKHALFIEHLKANNTAEADRRFCRHNMSHFLDVARIGYLLCLEEGQEVEQERIYAAALLHDLGKHIQYETGIGHELASAEIAPVILKDCGFSLEETEEICQAILRHRDPEAASCPGLTGLLYRADKASRSCFACEAEKDCNWKGEKKNLTIRY